MSRDDGSKTGRARSLPLVGAQLSSAGGWGQVPGRAATTGAEVVQVFSSNPRIWPTTPPDRVGLGELDRALRAHGQPLFFHAIYLINPSSPDPRLRERSVDALAHALLTGALAGAAGVVTHLGSHRGEGFDKAVPWIVDTTRAAWVQARHGLRAPLVEDRVLPPLLLETAAGSGATVGGTLAELQTLVDDLARGVDSNDQGQVGVCLDTAHMFAAGYAVHQHQGLADLVSELETRDLLRRVGLIHLNDSASLFASKRDRHANPGEGELGYQGLARLVQHPAFATIPFVLEVPGPEGHGPGAAQIKTVKRMRQAQPYPLEKPADSGTGREVPA